MSKKAYFNEMKDLIETNGKDNKKLKNLIKVKKYLMQKTC